MPKGCTQEICKYILKDSASTDCRNIFLLYCLLNEGTRLFSFSITLCLIMQQYLIFANLNILHLIKAFKIEESKCGGGNKGKEQDLVYYCYIKAEKYPSSQTQL